MKRLRENITPGAAVGVSSRRTVGVSVYRQSSPMDMFYHQTYDPAYGSSPTTRIVNDVYMLLNQKRLDRMTLEAFSQHMTNMQVNSPRLASLRSKVSDADLLKFCKSRFVQAPSELLRWSQYLDSMYPEQTNQTEKLQQPQQEQTSGSGTQNQSE